MSLETYLRAAPKAELHLHLEGAIPRAALEQLAARHDVALPPLPADPSGDPYLDFEQFIAGFLAAVHCLRSAEDYDEAVHAVGAELARQHVRYAEVTFSPSTAHVFGVDQATFMDGLRRGRARVLRDFDLELNWVFNIVRRWNDAARTAPLAEYTTSVAIEGQADGVVALGLGGLEEGAPPEPFAPYFQRARAAGLHADPHAGELAGPASIWGAIQALGAERLGHGVRAIEDPALVAYLAEHVLPIEVNPTSNLRLGVYARYADHPLPRLLAAGVPLTVNSDDPPLFNTTVTDELLLLPEVFGLEQEAIEAVVLNGVRQSFLAAERKAQLLAQFEDEFARLAAEHLGS